MGYSQEHVASTRQRILDEAGRLMRKHGQAGVSINQIMEAADLTHGGFYAHFKSKKELFTAMVGEDFDFTRQLERLLDSAELDGHDRASIAVSHYLDPGKSEKIAQACTIASSTQDIVRADKRTRSAFTRGFKRLVEVFSKASEVSDARLAEKHAMASLATSVGALVIANALEDRDFAARLLNASQQAVADMTPE